MRLLYVYQIVAREQRILTEERDSLQSEVNEQKAAIRKLENTIDSRNNEIEDLKAEIKRLNRLIDQLKTIEAESRATQAALLEQARKELECYRSREKRKHKTLLWQWLLPDR